VVKSDQRLGDVRFWEKEVDDKLGGLKGETEALEIYRNRLSAAIEAYEEPLRIAQLCLANRSVLIYLSPPRGEVFALVVYDAAMYGNTVTTRAVPCGN